MYIKDTSDRLLGQDIDHPLDNNQGSHLVLKSASPGLIC